MDLRIYEDGTIVDGQGHLAGLIHQNPVSKAWTAKPQGGRPQRCLTRLGAIDHIRQAASQAVGYCKHHKRL